MARPRNSAFRPRTWPALIALALFAAACAAPPAPPTATPATITVGSKDFAEQFILGEMYSLLLENAGYRVERRLDLGPTPVAQAALETGQIDLYPEYTGTGLLLVLNQPAMSDPAEVYDAVSKGYRDRFGLTWLAPAPANNTQAIAMTKSEASRLRVVTLEDFAARAREVAAQGTPFKLAGPPGFLEREDGLPGLRRAFGDFEVEYRVVPFEDRYDLLTAGEVDAAVAFGTDGEMGGFDLAQLIDTTDFFPPYQVAPVVRETVLDRNPGIADALNPLAPRLTESLLRELNFRVTREGEAPADVARAFLIDAGLIPGQPIPAPVNYVGAYRLAALDGPGRISAQLNLVLNPDGVATLTAVSMLTDTLDTDTTVGRWTQVGNAVAITFTQAGTRTVEPPILASLAFDGHFITDVEVANDPLQAPKYTYFIASGDRGPVIRELHRRMAEVPWLGFSDPGPSKSTYDEATRQAIVAFQTQQGLLPTGFVDATTWRALGNPQPPTTAAPPAAPTHEPIATPTPKGVGQIARGNARGHGRMRMLAPAAQATLVPTRQPPGPAPTLVPTVPPPGQPQGPEACTPQVTVGADATNLRQAPSTNAPVLTVLPAGTVLTALAVNSDRTWYEVDYYGTRGWVFGELVTPSCVENLPVVDAAVPAPEPSAPAQPPTTSSGEKVIYLSYDDGPHGTWTPQIIEVLQQNDAKAVFFQIGQQVPALGDLVKQQLAAGMSIGNHTWNHPSLAGMSQDEFNAQITRTQEAQQPLGAYAGAPPHCLRPPYGATDANTGPWAEALGYRVVLWTIDPQDWAMPGTQQIVDNILSNARPGAIILSHDGGGNRSQTVDAYRIALPELRAQGYTLLAPACP